jgi:geranylgeranyl diphosphate synthase type II
MLSDPNGSFQRQLYAWRDLALSEIDAGLPTHEPHRHLYDLIRTHLSRSGKGIRPALCIATAKAFGGKEANALPSAAALEMLHNAFLVHDDVEDGSDLRRNRPTLVAEHGVPLAVNTGDAMNALSIRLLRRNLPLLGPETAIRIYEEIDTLLVESLEGQAMELGWIRDNDTRVTPSDYLRMTLKKTCRYSFIHPMRIGALVADGERTDLDRFDRLGFFVGAAFQIQDDVLNLIGDRRYGKEIGGDLMEGKRSLILAHLFEQVSGRDGDALRDFFGRPRERRLPREVNWIYQLLRRYGSIQYAQQASRELTAAAVDEFDTAFGGARDDEAKRFVRGILDYVVEREA